MAPLLSIIIPVYNAQATVERTLRSLERIAPAVRQGVEVVVVDDGSRDKSLAIVEQTAAGTEGFNWKIISKPNGGASSARNRALETARGEWVFFLDADDELQVDLVPLAAAHVEASCLAFALEYRRYGKFLRKYLPPLVSSANHLDILTANCPFQPSSLLFRRDRIDQPFDESVVFGEDWLFWIQNPRIFQRMSRHAGVVVATIHIHGENISAQYQRRGQDRQRVARQLTMLLEERLTARQRNNLYLQAMIGGLQADRCCELRAFATFPADLRLYAKLWIYAAAAVLRVEASPYGRAPAETTVSSARLDADAASRRR